MNRYRYSISLRIRHPDADPSKFSRQLGLRPHRAWQAGRPRMTPTGQPLKGNNRETYWTSGTLLCGSWPKQSLTLALNDLLDRLAPQKRFFKRIRSENGEVEFFVGWYFTGNSGDVIGIATLKRMSDLGIDLSLDVYPPDQPQRDI